MARGGVCAMAFAKQAVMVRTRSEWRIDDYRQRPRHFSCSYHLIDMAVAYSVLDLAPVRDYGSIAETFRNSLDLAQHGEGWGYTRFWMAEHHNMPGIASAATSVLIGYIAGGTSRIRVGSGGVMLPNHAPLVIAEQFGTLETLYPGRIDLGLGRAPGTDGVTVRALRRVAGSTDSDFPQQLEELLQFLGPVQPRQLVRAVPGAGTNVPVWLLGSSTFSAQLAAQMGLPFAFAGHFAPQEMRRALELYRAHFEPSQYLNEPYSMAALAFTAAETDEQARFLSTTSAQRFLRLIRGEPFLLSPPVEDIERLWSPEEKALVASRFSAAIIGSRATVHRKLAAFLDETGVDEIMVQSEPYAHADRLRSFQIVAEVFKELNSQPSKNVLSSEVGSGMGHDISARWS